MLNTRAPFKLAWTSAAIWSATLTVFRRITSPSVVICSTCVVRIGSSATGVP